MKIMLARFLRGEEGQDLVEYVLLAGLIALAASAAMTALVGGANGVFMIVVNAVTGGS